MAIPENYIFRRGEKVVILANGPWEGETAAVWDESSERSDNGRVLVDIACNWTGENSVDSFNSKLQYSFLKTELALWNFPKEDDFPRPVEETRKKTERLMKLLSLIPREQKIATLPSKRKNEESSHKRKSSSPKRKK